MAYEKLRVYNGLFKVDCGISYVFETRPDTLNLRKYFSAEDDSEAFWKAFSHAQFLTLKYIPDPNTEKTTVTIKLEYNGEEVNQSELIRKMNEGRDPDELRKFLSDTFPDGRAVIVADELKHMMVDRKKFRAYEIRTYEGRLEKV